jgi:hypothetical protein
MVLEVSEAARAFLDELHLSAETLGAADGLCKSPHGGEVNRHMAAIPVLLG